METKTTVSTVHHAAHFGYGMVGANDLLEIDSVQPKSTPYPNAAIAARAEYHHVYIDKDGNQHFVYVKSIAALPGSTCERCK